VIDLVAFRRDPESVKAALARRGVDGATLDELVTLDSAHRSALQSAEALRAEVKEISRQVGEARRAKDDAQAEALMERSRALGEEEREAHELAERAGEAVRAVLLMVPNVPAPETPDGLSAEENVEICRWWPGREEGADFPTFAEHQRVAHWESGRELNILDMEAGAKLAGSMFPLFRGDGSRLMRALGSLSLARNGDAYEEIRPPSVALTETMTSTGHLPKAEDDMYRIERDDLWLIPTAEVPLTSMHRDEILDESRLPIKMTAFTPCFRREAGAAGRDTRGLLRVHEFDKVELFAYCTPEQAQECFDDIVERAEGLLRALGLIYRVLDLCAGDLGASSARTFDLEVYSPGVDRWLEVSSVSWFRDYQTRRAQVRYRSAGAAPQLAHTVNGSAFGFSRIWAAVIETYRQADGTIELPEVLAPFMGGRRTISRP
jgi:seryl-tRNA synthetase